MSDGNKPDDVSSFQAMEKWLDNSHKENTEEGCNLLSSLSIEL